MNSKAKHISTHIITALLAALFTFSLFSRTALAADDLLKAPVLSDGMPDPVFDTADILSDSEEQELREAALKLRQEQSFDVVVLTLGSTGARSATEYADDYYMVNGYGPDQDHSGILLLIAMNDRTWATSTAGSGISIFTEDALYSMEDKVIPRFSSGDYAYAFLTYMSYTDRLVTQANTVARFSLGNLFLCIILGLIAALIPLRVQMSRLDNVHKATDAGIYHAKSGLKLRVSNDTFLRHVVTHTPIPQVQSRGGGGGGISHMGSGGMSHGGHSGKF